MSRVVNYSIGVRSDPFLPYFVQYIKNVWYIQITLNYMQFNYEKSGNLKEMDRYVIPGRG
jgi:hypothetical protein